jgi:beta-lactamase class A
MRTLLSLLLAAAAPMLPQARPAPAARPATDARSSIEKLTADSGAEVSVAFRTLDGRDQLFVREAEPFHAASTMKIPVMIEMYRQADAKTISLDQPVAVVNEFKSIVDGSPFRLSADDDSEKSLYAAVGQSRTWRELNELMITESSNLATNILIDRLGVANIRKTAAALGADGMDVRRGVEDNVAFRAGQNNTTTSMALLRLLESLANGTAVSREASREMVDVLARQRFNESIPAGLPPGTRVAHKTGSITRIQHDAAIVFAPRPYVLVVLVRGLDDESKGHALIASIARVVDASLRRQDPAPRH